LNSLEKAKVDKAERRLGVMGWGWGLVVEDYVRGSMLGLGLGRRVEKGEGSESQK